MNITTQLADALRATTTLLRGCNADGELFAEIARRANANSETLATYDAQQEAETSATAELVDAATQAAGWIDEAHKRHGIPAWITAPRLDAAIRAFSPYARRVRQLEAEGMTTSDAQAVADTEGLDDDAPRSVQVLPGLRISEV